jgi:lysozyme
MSFAEHTVEHFVTVPLTQGQFDGLVDFVYNEGAGTFQKSLLLKKVNAKAFDAVPGELRRYIYAGGKILDGLVTRRAKEIAVFTAALGNPCQSSI